MSSKHFAAFLGFFFVAAWIGFSFGHAILCLLGAGVFAGLAAIASGEVDLADVQGRVQAATRPAPPAYAPPPRPAAAPRVR